MTLSIEIATGAGLKPLLGLTDGELSSLFEGLGEPAYRGKQVADALYKRGARDFNQLTNLSKGLRDRLQREFALGRSEIVTRQQAKDGTVKLLLGLADGQKVESVALPYEERYSCCVSTQVGCPVKCAFCATGLSGYTRNLTAGEIVDQVLTVQDVARESDPQARVSNVVFMGMGEPLMNYDATLKALHLLNDEVGIGMRHLTVSTVGYVPGIRRLAKEKLQCTLAISLHAPNDELRRQLIPTMHKWDIKELMSACRDYFNETHRRLTFEYCLLRGVNDQSEHAQELAALLQGMNCHVNLIPFNPVEALGFKGPKKDRIRAFKQVLEESGVQVTQRVQRGVDIDAACGQLRRRAESAANKES
ncbi:MAG: 23S rRNA (adenine(2503)-C(2))-methyltransferase RlmN [SAR202 cluster bacterium]|nr:23S rRNA (adenine(2503)-C(2))-methyltransferase RlmN [SAR202 cluster bacterium]